MTTIGPLDRLLSRLRSGQLTPARPRGATPSSPPDVARPDSQGELSDLPAQLARQIGAIAPEDPDRRRKAFRAYLAGVLGHELGLPQLDGPGLLGLTERVQAAMERDEGIRAAIIEAGDELLRTYR